MKKRKILAFMLAASTTGVVVVENEVVSSAEDNNNIKRVEGEKSSRLGTVVNVSSNLRIREGNNIKSKVIGYLNSGTSVKIHSKSGVWFEIESNGIKGYAHSDYIKENGKSNNNNSNNISSINKSGNVINVTTSLRVRSDSNLNSSVIGYLRPGETVKVKNRRGNWFEIKYDGRNGFVHKDYIKIKNEGSSNGGSSNSGDVNVRSKKGQVINVSSSLRVRSGAGLNSSVVGYLLNSHSFDILAKNGDWFKINKDGLKGYIHKDYVKVVDWDDSKPSKPSINGNAVVVNVSSNLRIRNGANLGSTVVGYLLNGENIKVLGKTNGWYKVQKGSIIGFVSSDYIKLKEGNNIPNSDNDDSGEEFKNQYGVVVNVSTNLRFRESPNTNSSVLGYLTPNEKVKILKKTGKWYKINARGKNGYVSGDYIKLIKEGDENVSPTYENIYKRLSSQIGSPYVWGGKGEMLTTSFLNKLKRIYPDVAAEGRYNIPSKYLNSGYRAFDCSGLLQWGFASVGINIGSSTYDQINAGREVSLTDIREGDLLFNRNLSHVGMYVGNGKWIEAPSSGQFVRIVNVPFNKINRARRILK